MNKIKDFQIQQVPQHAIVIVITTDPDYSMDRTLFVENWPEYKDYTIITGEYYDFDDTKWEAITYTSKELKRVIEGWQGSEAYIDSERIIAPLITKYMYHADLRNWS